MMHPMSASAITIVVKPALGLARSLPLDVGYPFMIYSSCVPTSVLILKVSMLCSKNPKKKVVIVLGRKKCDCPIILYI